jgi:hypothetical protein
MKGVPIALAFLLTLCAAAAAQVPNPGCTSRPEGAAPLFLGVKTQIFGITCPAPEGNFVSTAHVIRVDLTVPGLTFEASSAPSVGSFTPTLTTTFLATTRSQIAINANLFTVCCTDTPPAAGTTTALQGLEISNGTVLSPLRNNPKDGKQPYPFATSLIVTANGLRIVTPTEPPAATTAVTGSHILVSGGQNVAPTTPSSTDSFFGPNPRTLVGLSADNKVLWIAAVDRLSENSGVTLPQAAQFMIQLGAATALNFDGGGSTSLAVQMPDGAPGLLNFPSDQNAGCSFPKGNGCERYVGASFGIHAQPLLPAASGR